MSFCNLYFFDASSVVRYSHYHFDLFLLFGLYPYVRLLVSCLFAGLLLWQLVLHWQCDIWCSVFGNERLDVCSSRCCSTIALLLDWTIHWRKWRIGPLKPTITTRFLPLIIIGKMSHFKVMRSLFFRNFFGLKLLRNSFPGCEWELIACVEVGPLSP